MPHNLIVVRSRLPASTTILPQEVEEKKRLREEGRQQAARLLLAGKSILVPWGTDDPFAGMAPEVRL
jgi:hypothetical protein